MEHLSVRPLEAQDVPLIIQYWLGGSPEFMHGMGVDMAKMPSVEQWETALNTQLSQSIPEKKSYCFIWLLEGQPVGHCNINKIIPGQEAYLHLHLWRSDLRQKGLGEQLVRLTLPHFFEAYDLQTLYCEPYALNPAPNKTLEKVGFVWEKTHVTTPGWLNFEQPVHLWKLDRATFLDLL